MNPPIAAELGDEWGDELLQSALELLRAPNDQDAEPLIRSVIQMFKDDIEQAIAAPRISDLKKKLRKIYQYSSGLERLLNDVDPYFQQSIFAYTFMDDWPAGMGEFTRPLVRDLPQLITALSGVAKSAAVLQERMPKDTGGEGTLFDILQQPPKRLFTGRCWEMFWQFRPGEARATIDGDFHIFCSLLYNLATGKNPNEEGSGAGLSRYVKEVVKACNELLERKPAIDRMRRAMANGETTLGLITDTGLLAALFGSPQQLHQLSSTKKSEKRER